MRRVPRSLVCLAAAAAIAAVSTLSLSGCIRRTDVGEGGRKRTQVSVAFWGGANEVIVVDKILKKFEKLNPDIRVKRIHIASDYNPKLQTMMAANRAPDVFYVLSQDCKDYLHKGALMDLAPFLARSKVIRYEDFFPVTVRQFKRGSSIYALSWDWSPMVVFYNKTFFDQAGVPYPNEHWTWSDFLEAAKRLTVRDKSGRIIRYGTLHVPSWVWSQWIVQNGGRAFNDAGDRCIIDSPEAVEALQFQYDLTTKYHVAPPPNDPEAENSVYFMSGKTAMVFSYRWFITFLDPLKRWEWRVGPIPRGKTKYNLSGAVGFAMSSQCKHPRAAWRLIEYLCGPQGQADFVESRWGVPTLMKLAADVERFEDPKHPHYNYRLFASEVKYSLVPPASPYIPEQQFFSICLQELDRLYLGIQNPAQTLRRIADQTNRIIRQNIARLRKQGRTSVGAEHTKGTRRGIC